MPNKCNYRYLFCSHRFVPELLRLADWICILGCKYESNANNMIRTEGREKHVTIYNNHGLRNIWFKNICFSATQSVLPKRILNQWEEIDLVYKETLKKYSPPPWCSGHKITQHAHVYAVGDHFKHVWSHTAGQNLHV